MASDTAPVVYLSYRWVDISHHGRPARAPDPRGRALADRLREQGVDVRLDVYHSESLHGFHPPERDPADPRDPWLAWATRQIAEADAVLMLCVPGYVDAADEPWTRWRHLDEPARIASRVPSVWWDWQAIAAECDTRPGKFIPVGIGPYHADLVPDFVRGATYQDLDAPGATEALLRRIRRPWRARTPRRGVFISYAHHDDQSWLDTLLHHLTPAAPVWTDRDILPGARWHEAIRTQLALARVAVLMVSPAFLASSYIRTEELPALLEAAAVDGLIIFWIPVRPSAYQDTPIAHFHAAHRPDRPLATLRGAARQEAFAAIAARLTDTLSA